MACDPLAQTSGFVGLAGVADLGQADVLDEHMGRDRHDRMNGMIGGINQRDRGAVAMSDEDGVVELQRLENLWQDVPRLLVHEGWGPSLWWRIGLPVAEARERHRSPARGRRQPVGKSPPQ